MADIKEIIKEMVDNGEPHDMIQSVIKAYKAKQAAKEALTQEDASVEGEDTASDSEEYSLDSLQLSDDAQKIVDGYRTATDLQADIDSGKVTNQEVLDYVKAAGREAEEGETKTMAQERVSETKKEEKEPDATELQQYSEEGFINYWNNQNIPGLQIETAGTTLEGELVKVKIPNQEPFIVDLGMKSVQLGEIPFTGAQAKSKEQALEGIAKIQQYQKNIADVNTEFLTDFSPKQEEKGGFLRAIGIGGGSGDSYTKEQVNYINNTYGDLGYKLEQVGTEGAWYSWNVSKDAEYKLTKDGAEVALGNTDQVQDFIYNDMLSKDPKDLAEISSNLQLSRKAFLAKMSKDRKADYDNGVKEINKVDLMTRAIDDGSFVRQLTGKMNFSSNEERKEYERSLQKYLDSSSKYTKNIENYGNGEGTGMLEAFGRGTDRGGELLQSYNSMFEHPEGVEEWPVFKMFTKKKAEISDELKWTTLENNIAESGLGRIQQAHDQVEERELKAKDKETKAQVEKQQELVDNWIDGYKDKGGKLASNAKAAGVTNITYNESTGLYKVEAADEEVEKAYQREFNKYTQALSAYQEEYGTTNQKLLEEQSSIAKQLQDVTISERIAGKNLDFVDKLTIETNASFNNTALSIPALFGNQNAIDKTNQINKYVQDQFQTSLQYGEVKTIEDALKFGSVTLAQQSAPIVIAMATAGAGSSVGLSSGAIQTMTAGTFGVSAAGGKRVELEGRIDIAAQAIIDLEELEELKDTLDPQFYSDTKYDLERRIAENDMTTSQYWSSIVSSGVVEGGITRFIGTVPNASKAWKSFANPVDDVFKAANREWYQNAAHKLGQFGYRTGGEVLEESLIYLGNSASESVIFGKEFEWDQLDETIITSIITSGSMNGPTLAYSGIMQHMANPELRQAFKDRKQELIKLKRTLEDPSLSQESRNILQSKITNINNSFVNLTDEMEAIAILAGPKKLGDIVSTGNKLNDLYQRAGVDPTLPEDQKNAKIQEYINGLDKAKAKTFKSELSILQTQKDNLIKSVANFENAPQRMYGVEGDNILNKLNEDPNFKNLSNREQAILVHQEFKKRETNRAIGRAKSDPGAVAYVENQVYGKGGFANAKTKDGKPRKRRNIQAENAFYSQVGAMINSRAADGLVINREENIAAKEILKDKRLEDLQLIQAKDDKDLVDKATAAYEDVLNQKISEINRNPRLITKEDKESEIQRWTDKLLSDRDAIISEINAGETNGAIVGGQYITTNMRATQEQINDGNILAGTVLSHEISHALDARAMTTPELTQYGKKLNNWMIDNDQDSHIDAMNHMSQTGVVEDGVFKPYYDRNKDIADQSDLFWDEYTKIVQDIYRRPSSRGKRAKLKTAAAASQGFLQSFARGDFNVDTDNKAAQYLSSFLEGFEKNKIGRLQKRKIDYKNSPEGRKELAASTRRSANSPILHSQANDLGKQANALYENKAANPEYDFDIAKLYEGMVKKFLDRMELEGKWDLGRERENNIQDFIMNATITDRGVLGLVSRFDPTEMVDVVDPKTGETVQEPNTISKWLNGAFPQRLTEFVKGTTIDPGIFKGDLADMAELVSTERADKLTDTMLEEVSNQFDTPLLEAMPWTQELLDTFRAEVAKTVGVKLPALDAKQGKNQSISPLIRALKKEFGVKNGPMHNVVKEMMGKTKAEVEAFLVDPENKKAILEAMTTSWLASNLPMAVEKKVRGVTTNDGYTTDHIGRKKGTKPGDIEAWNSSEEGPYRGMTDGKQKIRRNPKATKDVVNAEILSKFAKGQTMTEMNRTGLTKLQLAMAQELGLETFKADMLNDGELRKIFEERQELFDRVLADNFVEEFVRQSERGVTKRSSNVNPNVQRQLGEEVLDAYINNKGDRSAFENEVLLRGVPLQMVNAFDYDTIDELMSDAMPEGYKKLLDQYALDKNVSDNIKGIIREANDMGAFNQVKDPEAGDRARIKAATEVGKLVDALPLEAFLSPVITPAFFGFSGSARGFDVSKLETKNYSPEAKKAMLALEKKIKDKQAEAKANRDTLLPKFISKYGFNPEAARLFNAGVGLMGKVEKNIQYANLTADQKLERHNELYGKEHEAANVANPLLLELVNNTFLDLARTDRNAAVGWVYWNSMNTNNTSGPRSLSTWRLTQYENGSQGLYKGVNYKTGEIQFFKTRKKAEDTASITDVEINKDHPNYKVTEALAEERALKLVAEGKLDADNVDQEIELMMFGGEGNAVSDKGKKMNWKTGLLRGKGEHVTASATTSGEIVVAGLKALDSKNFEQAKAEIKKLTQAFDQALGAKSLSDIQDRALGTTSRLGYGRAIALKTMPFTKLDSFKTLDGKTAGDLAVDQFLKQDELKSIAKIKAALSPITAQELETVRTIDRATELARRSANPRGMSTFDFDDTLIVKGENFVVATKGKESIKISSENFPLQGPKLAAAGYKFDFKDFVNVKGGVEGPLMQKLKNQIAKYGSENVFVLTARMQDSAPAIQAWLKTKGVDLSIDNITGLGNSTGEAKAMWMLDKFAEGYNDMYFVDDALPNVKAVKNVLDQLDIKSNVQITRRSANPSQQFNSMLDRSKGIPSDEKVSAARAKAIGKKKGKLQVFIPPSAEDFEGLMYYNYGKGTQGDADIAFFKKNLYDPFNRADRELDMYKQTLREDIVAIKKAYKDVSKKLKKDFGDTDLTTEQAIRVYLYDKAGHQVPGLSKAEQKSIASEVAKNPEMVAFANDFQNALKLEDGYLSPKDTWMVGSLGSDTRDASDTKRAKYLQEWQENADVIFSEENLNKLEALHGTAYREALEDILHRMKTGNNRPQGNSKIVNKWLDWVNGSVGSIMFFNSRSAVLQTLSTVNFINFEDNNIFAASKAFANQPQFWADFKFLFNSPMLKQRRSGIQTDVTTSEIANAAKAGGAKGVINYLLKIGFTPTQIADSFAIAAGGSTFYRNRINKYTKLGYDQATAEQKAFDDFQEIAEATQQSSRPDRISQQQASPLGRLILAFQNTPMQYNRLMKKAALDLINGRGNTKSNISRIIYYGAIQNFIFSALQNALFAVAFDDEEDEEFLDKKVERIGNGMLDSLLRGSGLTGAVIATVKNTIMKFMEERDKDFKADYGKVVVEALNISPPIGSKVRKLYSAMITDKWNKDVYKEIPLYNIDHPIWDAAGNTVEATTNAPLGRLQRKLSNLKAASDNQNAAWQRVALLFGWNKWGLGIDNKQEVKEAREKVKEQDAEESRDAFKKEQEKEKKEGKKEITCAASNKAGVRCKKKPVNGVHCTIHQKVKKREDGKETVCKKIKSDGSRCKMKTTATSGLCYYHD